MERENRRSTYTLLKTVPKSQREKGCETLQTYEFTDLRTQKKANSKAHELKKQ